MITKDQIAIGQIWKLQSGDPFIAPVKVLDLRAGFVQYAFLNSPSFKWSLPEEEFLRLYRLDR